MSLRKDLVSKLIKYREEKGFTTYALRKIERAKQPKPIAGVNVTTLNSIEKDPTFAPSRDTIFSLLDFFNIKYKLDDFGNPQKIKHETECKSR